MLAPHRRALLQAVTMADVSHNLKFYELTAICSRRVAEMYVKLVLKDKEYFSLGEGLWMLPEDTPMELWNALTTAQNIGNKAAHAQEERMQQQEGDEALRAAMTIAGAYLMMVHERRARL